MRIWCGRTSVIFMTRFLLLSYERFQEQPECSHERPDVARGWSGVILLRDRNADQAKPADFHASWSRFEREKRHDPSPARALVCREPSGRADDARRDRCDIG